LVEAETILQVVSVLSVAAALLYDAMTIRSMEKARRKDFIFESNVARNTPEYFEIYQRVSSMVDHETAEEFNTKYDAKRRAEWNYLAHYFNVVGVALREGVATPDEIFWLYPSGAIIDVYELSEPILRRYEYRSPGHWKPFEELCAEARKRTPGYVSGWKRARSAKQGKETNISTV